MYFLTSLPKIRGLSTIWVVVDRLIKYAHFIVLPAFFTARDLACHFNIEIFHLHRLPNTIVSDHDRLFLKSFQNKLFQLRGTHLHFSTTCDPKSDGQNEVLTYYLFTYPCYFTSNFPCTQVSFLHMVEYQYNSAHHSLINQILITFLCIVLGLLHAFVI